jgi:hypothetical protein
VIFLLLEEVLEIHARAIEEFGGSHQSSAANTRQIPRGYYVN